MHVQRMMILLAGLLLGVGRLSAAPVEFSATDINGHQQRAADYRGKWVVVNYWATWCPPCLEEIPDLVHFHEEHKDSNAVVIGINMETLDSMSLMNFVDQNFVTYPVIPGNGDVPMVGDVPGLPTTYLINPEGELVARQVGMITGDAIDAFIAAESNKD